MFSGGYSTTTALRHRPSSLGNTMEIISFSPFIHFRKLVELLNFNLSLCDKDVIASRCLLPHLFLKD